jgi:thioredoxin
VPLGRHHAFDMLASEAGREDAMTSAELREVTDQSFAGEVLAAETPMLVDFFGDHCPACRQIAPLLKQLAADYAGRLRIVTMHAAENPATAARFGVRAMPTVLAFARGRVVGQLVGARPKPAFVELIDRALAAPSG